MPLVPGYNDNEEHILQLSAFLNSIGKDEINILPLHHLGREKYNLLGKNYFTENFTTPSKESINYIQSVFKDHSINCYISSDMPF
jgi:pyruvate formate lyase activating enzyme